MSYGEELRIDRFNLRTWLRRNQWGAPPGYGKFLDEEDLMTYVDLHGGNLATPLNRKLIPLALRVLGVSPELIRKRLALLEEEPVDLTRGDLFLDPKYAAAIEAEVLHRLPGTPEPTRGPAPVHRAFDSGNTGPVDPAWVRGGGQPH